MKTSRRTFMMTVAASSAALAGVQASAQAVLDEKDPAAVGLGYVADTTKADTKKFPKHDNSQHCSVCALWASKPTDKLGNCALFAGKQVHAEGWCSAFAKKG